MQAPRLGAVLRSPCNVRSMRAAGADWVLDLDDGAEIRSRSVILALGARYRRLDVDELGRFEGAGVYYAATDLEARSVAPAPAVVVGGGNSAGQAAVHLAGLGCPVTVVVRGDGLAASMSTYLIDRIEAHPHIELRTRTEVRALAGSASLESVELEHTPSGRRDLVPCRGLFSFIGASAPTDWLRDLLALDPSGFVLTDRLLRPEDLGPAWRDGDLTPLPFETSCPGVFAVGDTRAGSMKRVAAAVGEGSSAVRSVHARLGAG
jgi:thioredoxin reductase (NADPH)